jgi:phosphoribosylformylglycinamidine cyclo-ligase
MFKLDKEYKNPILVACTDGVGTKVALAQEANKLDGIGQDLVAMCVNDLIVCGAKPLFFLDYFASSKLEVDEASKVIKSIASACKDSGCALLGGETAEMPGHYLGKNFDLAGFSVGCVEEDRVIDSKTIKENDILIGIESSGPHSNGFSLIRKIIKDANLNKDEYESIVELAMKPTHLYPNLIMDLINKFDIHGMAHITGGGLTENIPRSIPKNLSASINIDSWDIPEIFKWLKVNGNLNDKVLIVSKDDSEAVLDNINKHNFKCFNIGTLINKENNNSVVFK